MLLAEQKYRENLRKYYDTLSLAIRGEFTRRNEIFKDDLGDDLNAVYWSLYDEFKTRHDPKDGPFNERFDKIWCFILDLAGIRRRIGVTQHSREAIAKKRATFKIIHAEFLDENPAAPIGS